MSIILINWPLEPKSTHERRNRATAGVASNSHADHEFINAVVFTLLPLFYQNIRLWLQDSISCPKCDNQSDSADQLNLGRLVFFRGFLER